MFFHRVFEELSVRLPVIFANGGGRMCQARDAADEWNLEECWRIIERGRRAVEEIAAIKRKLDSPRHHPGQQVPLGKRERLEYRLARIKRPG